MEIQNKDIFIHNGMCTFSLGCKLNPKEIQAWSGTDVISCTETSRGLTMKFRDWPSNDTCTIYSSGKAIIRCNDSKHRAQKKVRNCARGLKRDGVKITKTKFHRRSATATIGRSGKATIAGNNSERHGKERARQLARILNKNACNAKLSEYKVTNMFGTYDTPFGIRIYPFARSHREAFCKPKCYGRGNRCEAVYFLSRPEAKITIRHTGSITVAAKSKRDIIEAIKHIYPLVEAHQKPLTEDIIQKRLARNGKRDAVNEDEGAEDEDTGDEDGDSDKYSSDDSSSDLSLFEYNFE